MNENLNGHEIVQILFWGNLLPIDNGGKSSAAGIIENLAKRKIVEVFLLADGCAIPNLELNKEWFGKRGIALKVLEHSNCAGKSIVPLPIRSWLRTFFPFGKKFIQYLKTNGIGREFATVIVFASSSWHPSCFLLGGAFSRMILWLSDSVFLFEYNRQEKGIKSFLRRKAGIIMAKHVERTILAAGYNYVTYVSPKDANIGLALSPKSRPIIKVVPIGIDVTEYSAKELPKRDQNILLFTGVMDYAPNRDAAEFLVFKVLPLLNDCDVKLRLVGKNAEQLHYLKGANVEIIGWVPSLAEEQLKATLFLSPLRMGAGAKNKVIQSLAAGVPVIGTEEAFSGFEILPPGAILASSAEEFSLKVRELLSDKERLASLRVLSRENALKMFSWERSVDLLENLIEHSRPDRDSQQV